MTWNWTKLIYCIDIRLEMTLAEGHQKATMRQTQVLVIPASEDLKSFQVFDRMIAAVNQARRNARDYVTDVSLDRLDENMHGDGDRDWW